MKKILFALTFATLASCSSTGNLTNIANSANKVANAANTISEISNIFNALNLTSTQTSKVTSALTNYIKQYNSLSGLTDNSANILNEYKTSALNEISNSLGQSKYGMFLNAAKEATNAKQSGLSAESINILSSLIK